MKEKIENAMNFESDISNWKYSFEVMSRKFGRDFIEILKIMWMISDQTENDFCEMNIIPKSFFEKVIKK